MPTKAVVITQSDSDGRLCMALQTLCIDLKIFSFHSRFSDEQKLLQQLAWQLQPDLTSRYAVARNHPEAAPGIVLVESDSILKGSYTGSTVHGRASVWTGEQISCSMAPVSEVQGLQTESPHCLGQGGWVEAGMLLHKGQRCSPAQHSKAPAPSCTETRKNTEAPNEQASCCHLE